MFYGHCISICWMFCSSVCLGLVLLLLCYFQWSHLSDCVSILMTLLQSVEEEESWGAHVV